MGQYNGTPSCLLLTNLGYVMSHFISKHMGQYNGTPSCILLTNLGYVMSHFISKHMVCCVLHYWPKLMLSHMLKVDMKNEVIRYGSIWNILSYFMGQYEIIMLLYIIGLYEICCHALCVSMKYVVIRFRSIWNMLSCVMG